MEVAIVYFIYHFSTVSKILISTGWDAENYIKNTEVIDSENSNVICEDLEDFSMEIDNAVGANLASMPIICGGALENGTSSNKCFIYTKGGWQHFVTMIDRREYAAGIVYDNALHIFGGYDSEFTSRQITLQSSEIVNEDGTSTKGPQLPTPMSAHAIAFINSTVSIISGVRTWNWNMSNSYTYKSWYFNHATQEFQVGPNLLEPRRHHSSGTITDQESKEKTVIVTGGVNGSAMDSTEILLNGKWVTGKNHRFVNFCAFTYRIVPSSNARY